MVKSLLAAAVIFLSGCTSSQYARTKCGLLVSLDSSPHLLESAEDLEEATMRALADPEVIAYDPRFKDACSALNGWVIQEVKSYVFRDAGRDVLGVTYCVEGVVFIGLSDSQHTSALPHELSHVVQRCNPPHQEQCLEDPDHCGWDVVYRALAHEGLE